MIQDSKLFGKNKPNRIRFRAMMESGLLVDEEADIVQTQVIAHKARASIRNRNTVPLYLQTEEDRSAVWKENLLVETGLSPPPGMDSRYNLEDARNLHAGIRSGAVEVDQDSPLKSHSVAIMVNVAAVVVFVVCGWLAGQTTQPATPTETGDSESVAEETVAEVKDQAKEGGRVSYEIVDTMADIDKTEEDGAGTGNSGAATPTGGEATGTSQGDEPDRRAQGDREPQPTGPDARSRFVEPLGSASGPDNATGPP